MRPPLDPSADEARAWLRRELLDPAYHRQDVVQQVLTWVLRQLDRAVTAASGAPPLSTLAAMLVLVGLVTAAGLLLSRARRTARTRTAEHPVLTSEAVSAADLRARAEQALAEGRHRDAVVDGFRALAVRQVEAGRLADAPGTTAREVAVALATAHPALRRAVEDGAALFDAVLYGDRPAGPEQARSVLALDDELTVAR